METTRHVDHGAPSKYLKQKAKPGLWIKDTNYELTAFWTTLKFEASLQTVSRKLPRQSF